MRFLLDQPISWLVGQELQAAGHQAWHVGELGLATADDSLIFSRAAADRCVIITQDTDYGTLLSVSGQRVPSVILLRMREGRPLVQAAILLRNLPALEEALREGAVVVLGDASIRIRKLPLLQARR